MARKEAEEMAEETDSEKLELQKEETDEKEEEWDATQLMEWAVECEIGLKVEGYIMESVEDRREVGTKYPESYRLFIMDEDDYLELAGN